MLDTFTQILDSVGQYGTLILAIVFVASVVESAFGVGAIFPGETVLVLAAVALRDSPLLVIAVIAAGAGAFLGDHIGFLIGRNLGTRMPNTRVIRRIGMGRWDTAVEYVEKHGFRVIVVARLLPGIRTLVAAAAGALNMPYGRFALATGIAAMIWSLLWVLGGAALGTAFLALVKHAGLSALVLIFVVMVTVVMVHRVRQRA